MLPDFDYSNAKAVQLLICGGEDKLDSEELIDVHQIATLLGVAVSTVREWVRVYRYSPDRPIFPHPIEITRIGKKLYSKSMVLKWKEADRKYQRSKK